MEPLRAPLVTEVCLGLCDFVGMVRERIVDAAAVQVEVFTERVQRDCGAFDVPAGIADAPRRIPFQFLIVELGLGEPKNEVALVALVAVFLNALADTDSQVFLVLLVEDIIFFQLGGIKINVAACFICVAVCEELFDHFDEVIDIGGCRNDDFRNLDVQLAAVRKECIGIELRDLHDGLVLTLGAFEHLVLTGIAVRGQVTDVGDVHCTLDIVACVGQVLFQHVLHDVGTEVADVCKVIDGRTAGVHGHLTRFMGDKFVAGVCKRVV